MEFSAPLKVPVKIISASWIVFEEISKEKCPSQQKIKRQGTSYSAERFAIIDKLHLIQIKKPCKRFPKARQIYCARNGNPVSVFILEIASREFLEG